MYGPVNTVCVLSCVLALLSWSRPLTAQDNEFWLTQPPVHEKEQEDVYSTEAIGIMMNEMMAKLNKVVGHGQSCQKEDAPAPQCLDLVSSQSVITQLCDRITALDKRLSKVTSYMQPPKNANPHPNHNSENSSLEIKKLKEQIENLKRSSAFFANKDSEVHNNFTHEKLGDYRVTVNDGVNFDPNSGVFTAPYEGIYQFSLNYQKKTPEVDLEACLVVDDVVIATANDERQAHLNLMTSLKVGQQVWTDVTSNSSPEDSKVTISFSGFLVV